MKRRNIVLSLFAASVLVAGGMVATSAYAEETPAAVELSRSLRDAAAARDITLGAAVRTAPLTGSEEAYRSTLAEQFSGVLPEKLTMQDLQPEPDRFDFTALDAMVAFAEQHHQEVLGPNLVVGAGLPQWLTATTDETKARAALTSFIETVVSRYRGRIKTWNVVAEALHEDGLRRNPAEHYWERRIGPEYVDLAFRAAHRADPTAKLFYRDYEMDEFNAKSDGLQAMLQDLLRRKVPVHGVGFDIRTSTWWTAGQHEKEASIRRNLSRIAGLGLQTDITALDVGIDKGSAPTAEKLAEQQNETYRSWIEQCLSQPACKRVYVFGVTDKYSELTDRFGSFLSTPLPGRLRSPAARL